MASPYEKLPRIPRYRDIVLKVTTRYRKLLEGSRGKIRSRKKARELEIKKLQLVHDIVAEEIRKIVFNLPFVDRVHPFYRDLLDVLIGYDKYKQAVVRLARALKIIDKIYGEYIALVKAAPRLRDARRFRKEGVGRIMSVLKRNRRYIDFLADNVPRLKRIPSIDPEKTTIIVAGMPQVGKSTLVKRISTAKPEIAPYPFTTKNLILGHITINPTITIQAIDTPGLLDRPLEERNPIELQAIMALKHLSGVIVYLFDASKNSYYTIEEQIHVLEDIVSSFKEKDIIIAVNKIDEVDENKLKKIIEYMNKKNLGKPILISALKGLGVDELLRIVFNKLNIEVKELFKAKF